MAADPNTPGLIEKGNINLFNRPNIPNPNGGISTVYSTSFGDDKGREILVPRAADGKILTEKEAEERYYRTGEHLGIFNSPDAATKYAEQLHEDYAAGKYSRSPMATPNISLPSTTAPAPPSGNSVDLAHAILAPVVAPDDYKAKAWEIFHNTQGADFEQQLGALQGISKRVKEQLWNAKANPDKFALQRPDVVAPPAAANARPVSIQPVPLVGATQRPYQAPARDLGNLTPEEYMQQSSADRGAYEQQDRNQRIQNLSEGTVGAAKSAGQTANTLLNVVAPVNEIAEKVSPGINKRIDAALTPQTEHEQYGADAETALEFMLGDEALKGLSTADQLAEGSKLAKIFEKYPKIATVVAGAARGGAVGGTVGGIHGGTEGAIKGAEGGAVAGGIGGALDVAGDAVSDTKNAVKKVLSKFKTQPLAEGVEEALAPSEAGAQIQSELQGAKQAAGKKVGAAREAVYPSPDTTVKIGSDSPLGKQVNTFLGQMPEEDAGLEALRSPETTKLRNTLTELNDKLENGWEMNQKQVAGLKQQLQSEASRLSSLARREGIGGTEAGMLKKLGSALNESEINGLSEQVSGPANAQAYSEAKQGFADIAERQRGLAGKAATTDEPSKIIDSLSKGNVSPESVKATLADVTSENLPKYRLSVMNQALNNAAGDWEKLRDSVAKKPEAWKALLGDEYAQYIQTIAHNTDVATRKAFLKKVGVGAAIGTASLVGGGTLARHFGLIGHAAKALGGE